MEAYRLIVDIGNTSTKLGVFQGQQLLRIKCFEHLEPSDWDVFSREFPGFSAAILCAVAPVPEVLQEVFAKIPCSYVWNKWDERYPIPMPTTYLRPQTLGRDRWAIALACQTMYPKENVLCISMGSCITYNLVTREGCFEPGCISPGMRMRFKAMHQFTQDLPLITEVPARRCPFPYLRQAEQTVPREKDREILGTEDALRYGCLKGIEYEVEQQINDYRKRYSPLRIVLTGGDVKYFDFSLKNEIFAHPNLVLRGMNVYLERIQILKEKTKR